MKVFILGQCTNFDTICCRFEDVVDVVLPSRTSIQISTKNKAYVFYTNRARQMKEMIDQYLHETDMVRNI